MHLRELDTKYTWLITGVAGFIGSNLLEYLLKNNQKVVGVDNFSTGTQKNIDEVLSICNESQKKNFIFYQEDIRDFSKCNEVTKDVDIVLHEAALGSVPRSLETPALTHDSNVDGMFNVLRAAKENKVKAFIYASSSSVYGDAEVLPKVENNIGKPLSPYAATKYIDEIYADVFARCYGMSIIGLRYFNVFGPRQNKNGPYAAVIPAWISELLAGKDVYINGDGSTSRDFTYVSDVVNVNMLTVRKALQTKGHTVYNVGAGERTTLLKLFALIAEAIAENKKTQPKFRDFREGDIKHSFADISLAKKELGYVSEYLIDEGIKLTVEWFRKHHNKSD